MPIYLQYFKLLMAIVFVIYLASFVGYLISSNKRALPIFLGGWGINLILVIINWSVYQQPPFGNMYHVLTLLPVALLPLYLLLHFRDKLDWLLPYFSLAAMFPVIGTIAMEMKLEWRKPPALCSNWFIPHVFVYMIAYALATVAFLLVMIHVIEKIKVSYHNDAKKTRIFLLKCYAGITTTMLFFSAIFIKDFASKTAMITFTIIILFPIVFMTIFFIFHLLLNKKTPMNEVDSATYQLIRLSLPFFTFGMLSGAFWAESAWGRYWAWDNKEVWALITWGLYITYLHCRMQKQLQRFKDLVHIIAFFALITTFFVVSFLPKLSSALHSYATM